jgi:flagellar basal body-associated protein FliL
MGIFKGVNMSTEDKEDFQDAGNMKLSSWVVMLVTGVITASALSVVNTLSQNYSEIVRMRVELSTLNENNKTILAALASQDERIRALEIKNSAGKN